MVTDSFSWASRLRRALVLPVVTAAAILALTGCGAVPTTTVERSLQVVNTEEAGTIVGTIGARSGRLFKADGSPYVFNTLYFRQVGKKSGGTLEFAPPDPPIRSFTPDFQNEKAKGNVFTVTLPAGEYELYSASFYYNNGVSEGTFKSKADFSIPFTVEKGKVTYLGSLVACGIWGKNFLKMPVPAGGYFVVEDQRARDLPLIQARHPAAGTATVKLLQPVSNVPFVRSEAPG